MEHNEEVKKKILVVKVNGLLSLDDLKEIRKVVRTGIKEGVLILSKGVEAYNLDYDGYIDIQTAEEIINENNS